MTTPTEGTKSIQDARELLQIPARDDIKTMVGLVQEVAQELRRHYPLDTDLDVSAGALSEVWAATDSQVSRPVSALEGLAYIPRAVATARLSLTEKTMPILHAVPDDFPRESTPAIVPGAQPKLLVRRVEGRYQSAPTNEELWTRYDACEDLARQLARYGSKKMKQFGWSKGDVLEKVEKSLNRKVSAGEWDLSPAEIDWVMKRTRVLMVTIGSGP
ncbi:BPSL0761 family protein [Paraburkholderia tropica]|uniref:BPSL0761 family protein n=1 Tax=Paraburkholderia tropica TaxID=92647 RepID=UPI001FC867DB|nr:BPSL0761 family protein [Paraburkholderia tropica]